MTLCYQNSSPELSQDLSPYQVSQTLSPNVHVNFWTNVLTERRGLGASTFPCFSGSHDHVPQTMAGLSAGLQSLKNSLFSLNSLNFVPLFQVTATGKRRWSGINKCIERVRRDSEVITMQKPWCSSEKPTDVLSFARTLLAASCATVSASPLLPDMLVAYWGKGHKNATGINAASPCCATYQHSAWESSLLSLCQVTTGWVWTWTGCLFTSVILHSLSGHVRELMGA